jgi:uncharacterized protein (TIGR03084 family)
MKTLAADFLAESDALHAIVEPLSETAIDQPTAFKGWTINTVLSHLHVWNLAAGMSLKGDGSFETFYAGAAAVTGRGGRLPEYEIVWLDGLAGRALVGAWREGFTKTAAAFSSADASARVKWAGPDMSVRSSLTARLMETWAHGQEIYDQLGLVRRNRDHIRNIVVLGNNTFGWTYKVRGEEPPAPRPHLRLTAPSGEMWSYNDASETDLIEGLAEEFCQVVTQTRNIADTQIRVVGAPAADWMSKAQCFAGGVETPPPAGTRRRLTRPTPT